MKHNTAAVKGSFKRTKGEISSQIVKGFTTIFLFIYAFSLLIPLFWMILNSFKGSIEYYLTPSYTLPESISFENYSYFLSNMKVTVVTTKGRIDYGLWQMFTNSLIFSATLPAFATFISLMCAYVIAKYKFVGRSFLFSLGIFVMIFPIMGSFGTSMIVKRALNIYDNMPLLILTAPAAAFSGFGFMMLHAAFKGISWEYAEAVFIDGGGHLRVFISIMLPMVFPTYAVLCLLAFLSSWSDYETFLVWLPSYANLALGMYKFQNDARITLGASMPEILAGFVLISIPTITLYLGVQNLLIANFKVGGLKG